MTLYIPADRLKQFMLDAFVQVGMPAKDAEICADVLICADKHGIDTHGISRFKPFYIDRVRDGIVDPVTKIEIVRESPTTAVIDGHNGLGQVVAKKAMQMAIDKANNYGLGMTAVRGSNHYGIAGYYALMAAENGMIGITGTNARPGVAPTFGIENMFGTNPLTFGMPTDEPFPFLLDCATSIIQRGNVEIYERLGEKVPEGLVIGQDGKSQTDPKQILQDLLKGKAAMLALGGIGEETGGHKGYGYATVVEILSAALSSGAFLRQLSGLNTDGTKRPINNGHFFMAINVENFVELNEFKKTTGTILRELRNSKKAPDAERIYTAGEKEYLTWQIRQKQGIPIDTVLLNELKMLAQELNLQSISA